MTPGLSIAHYRIASKLGEGGMGAVYRATDTKLNRDVAIKVLPDSLAEDADRLTRFSREAQVLASLNHPNIASIYGVEDRALVMELVEGQTLRGPLSPEEALPVIQQLVEALEYAHEKGIVHRDLKPANIKITPEGRLKVLDFGLAKAVDGEATPAGDPAVSPTLTMRATMAGVIMGTAGYMAPEQARGQNVDKRADIWAFGVVVYELLTGNQLFDGPTVSDTLAAVLTREPDLSTVPARFRRLLKVTLVRDARQRMRDISGARLLLDEVPDVEPAAPVVRRSGVPLWAVAALVLLAALVPAVGWWRVATRPTDRPLMRFVGDLGPEAVTRARSGVALSPDGTRMVFSVRSPNGTQLATQLLSQPGHTVLPSTTNGGDFFFSRDGQWVAFAADGKLKKVSVQGGAAITLCDSGSLRGGWWADGSIIATLDGGRSLVKVPVSGGQPQVIAKASGPETHYLYPQLLPNGDTVLVSSAPPSSNTDEGNILAVSLRSGESKVIHRNGFYGRYHPSGHLTYTYHGSLFAVPFDISSLEVRGTPIPMIEDVSTLSFSDSGMLVYLSGDSRSRQVATLERSGKYEILPGAIGRGIELSPDGKRLALTAGNELAIYDLERGILSKLPAQNAIGTFPVWSRDSRYIAFLYGSTLSWVRADGSAKPIALLDAGAVPTGISADGRLLMHRFGEGRDTYALTLDLTDPDHPKAGTPEPFITGPGDDVEAGFSPDGRWVAYGSVEAGVSSVFVRPAAGGPKGAGKWQVSSVPGRFPRWSPNGNELFYVAMDGHIMVSRWSVRGETFVPGTPERWTDTTAYSVDNTRSYDVFPDGKRMVFVPATDPSNTRTVHATFLLNFYDELKRRVK